MRRRDAVKAVLYTDEEAAGRQQGEDGGRGEEGVYSSALWAVREAESARPFRRGLVLGIESSCDDTAVAVVEAAEGQGGHDRVLAQCVYSQAEAGVHAEYGGIVPKLARRHHDRVMDAAIRTVLREAGLSADPSTGVDAVAVTAGPGLEMCLWAGINAAKKIQAPRFVAVHHLAAHMLVPRLPELGFAAAGLTQFPYLACLVSGGHTMIVKVNGVDNFSVLGGTLDDSLGETLDKSARLLGLAGASGTDLEHLALQGGDPHRFRMPRPLWQHNHSRTSCTLSFTGLKTNFRRLVARHADALGGEPTLQDKRDLAASMQRAAFDHTVERLDRALQRIGSDVQSCAVVGGVGRNATLRRMVEAVCERHGVKSVLVPPALCTDNGVMVAWAGAELLRAGVSHRVDDVIAMPRWPVSSQMHMIT